MLPPQAMEVPTKQTQTFLKFFVVDCYFFIRQFFRMNESSAITIGYLLHRPNHLVKHGAPIWIVRIFTENFESWSHEFCYRPFEAVGIFVDESQFAPLLPMTPELSREDLWAVKSNSDHIFSPDSTIAA